MQIGPHRDLVGDLARVSPPIEGKWVSDRGYVLASELTREPPQGRQTLWTEIRCLLFPVRMVQPDVVG